MLSEMKKIELRALETGSAVGANAPHYVYTT
jgi:hypothetical protein